MNLEHYLLNVALHAVALSAASIILVALIRNPRAKASVALGCLLAVGGLSWLSPLRPAATPALSIPILPSPPVEVIPMPPAPSIETARIPETTKEAPLPTGHRVKFPSQDIAPLLWAAGALAGLLRIAASLWRVGRWQASLAPVGERERILIEESLPLEVDHDSFRISEEPVSPCVAGFLKPKIVIPRSLLDGSKPRELAWALRHELAHLAGHDSRWAVAVRVFRSLFWWNPMIHGLARTWSEARERTCDQVAATQANERADYGDFLVTMAASLSPRPTRGPSMAKHGAAKRLKRRVASLLAAAPGLPTKVSRLQVVGCGLTFTAVLGATTLLAFEKKEAAAGAGNGNLTLEKILNPPPQLDVSMALLKTGQPFCTQGQIFTPAELELKLQSASNGRGIQLLPLPRRIEEVGTASWAHLTSCAGDEADTTTPPWDGENTTTPFLGWVVGWKSRPSGENLNFSVRAAYSFALGYHLAPGFGTNDSSRHQVNFEASAEVPSGKAVGFTFGEVEPGVHISVIFGLVVAKPWELPALWEPGEYPSISPKAPPLGLPVKMTEFKSDDPDYLQAQKSSIAANKAWIDAMNALPENAEFIRQREFFIGQLKERLELAKELNWKIHRLGEAIVANAEMDVDVRLLAVKSTRLSRITSEIHFKILNARDDELRKRELERQRWEMHQFERQRHRW